MNKSHRRVIRCLALAHPVFCPCLAPPPLPGGIEGLPVTDPAARATPLDPARWRDMLKEADEVNRKIEAGLEDEVGLEGCLFGSNTFNS